MLDFTRIRVSPERADSVLAEIARGSAPQGRFFLLLIVSTMIAAFGLVVDSTAIIIGAMLVSPLMTPIFGVALGMLRGDSELFWRALGAELIGAALAVCAAFLFGLTELAPGATYELTWEMAARTKPSVIDLLVAVFAGLAGGYALVDERTSPALPGVAISVSIVPPLATAGLCFAMGGYSGGLGAVLLFLANFVSILLVALIVFVLTGLAPGLREKSWRELMGNFAPAVLGFVVMTVVLTSSFYRILQERTLVHKIEEALNTELAHEPRGELEHFEQKWNDDRLQVLATVLSTSFVRPERVAHMQKAIADATGFPADLVVRAVLAHDVTPPGSTLRTGRRNFDGIFLSDMSDTERARAVCQHVLIEVLQTQPGVEVHHVQLRDDGQRTTVIAEVDTVEPLSPQAIADAETEIRQRLDRPNLRLIVRQDDLNIADRYGTVLVGWSNAADLSSDDRTAAEDIARLIRESFVGRQGMVPIAIRFQTGQGHIRVLVEIVGPDGLNPAEVQRLQEALAAASGRRVRLDVLHKADFVVTSSGYSDFTTLIHPEASTSETAADAQGLIVGP